MKSLKISIKGLHNSCHGITIFFQDVTVQYLEFWLWISPFSYLCRSHFCVYWQRSLMSRLLKENSLKLVPDEKRVIENCAIFLFISLVESSLCSLAMCNSSWCFEDCISKKAMFENQIFCVWLTIKGLRHESTITSHILCNVSVMGSTFPTASLRGKNIMEHILDKFHLKRSEYNRGFLFSKYCVNSMPKLVPCFKLLQ